MGTVRSLNKVILIGNLTRPPVLRKTTNGALVGTFGIATNATWKDADGNIQERAEFHDLVVWNKLAEICAQILNVGMLVYVEGEIRKRTGEDSRGQKFVRIEVKVNDMKLLDSKDKKGLGIDEALKAGETNGHTDEYAETPVASNSDVIVDEMPEDTEVNKKDAEDLF